MKFLTLLYAFTLGFLNVVADEEPYHEDDQYDQSVYGLYPVQRFMSTGAVAPRPNLLRTDPRCSNLYTFMTPRGGVAPAQATILDHNGHLVWTIGGYNQVYNLLVQKYNGEDYLTFWAGNDAVGGHGAGFYYMVSFDFLGSSLSSHHPQLDTSYNQILQISAANGLDADLHDFRITEQGTAIFTVYEVVNTDLTSLGKDFVGEAWDCLIQEIDLSTGGLVFQWRALDHYDISDTYRPIDDDGTIGRAFDFFHINSVDKDPHGNYLTSSRYLHCITYINGTDGSIIWILGGKKNMFTDLSSGDATNFAYQHDARWSDDGSTITMFDNGVDDSHPDIADTRGLRIAIDQVAMTAQLITTYTNPHGIHGISQGSFQTLDNGNVIMGYGNTAAFTEYANNGEVLCDTHFGPENRFGSAEVQSYRVYKFDWHATPITDPDVVIVQQEDESRWSLYVSWNGATEISTWILQGSDDSSADDGAWIELERREKDEFEEEFELGTSYPRYLRAIAISAAGDRLGVAGPRDIKEEKVLEFSSPFISPTTTNLTVSFDALLSLNITDLYQFNLFVQACEVEKTSTDDGAKIWSLPALRIEERDTWWLKIIMGFCVFTGLGVGMREAIVVFHERGRRRNRRREYVRLNGATGQVQILCA